MRCVAIRIRPRFFSRKHCCRIGKTLGGDQALKGGEPVFVVVRTIVGLASVSCRFELFGQSRSPLFPSEIAQLGEFDGESKSLCLPRFGKDRSLGITRQGRKRCKTFRRNTWLKLVQDSHPTCPRKPSPVVPLGLPTIRARRSAPNIRAAAFPRGIARSYREKRKRHDRAKRCPLCLARTAAAACGQLD